MKEQEFKIALSECKTVKEMFDTINKYYEIENTKPGSIVRATLVGGLLNGLKITQAKLR
jgi:hypothetical protein